MKYNLRSLSFFLRPIVRSSSNRGIFIVGALVSLMGCSGSSSIQIDAPQPVYFGGPPRNLLLLDSAHLKFIGPFVATTSHFAEKENTTTIKGVDITSRGVEQTESSMDPEIAAALEGDPDRFISDVSADARVEVYMPWDTVFFDLLALMLSQKTTSSGGGDASSETIAISGKVYRQGRDKR